MPLELEKVVFRLEAETEQLRQAVRQAQEIVNQSSQHIRQGFRGVQDQGRSLNDTIVGSTRSFFSFGLQLAAVAGIGLGVREMFTGMVREARESEASMLRFEATLKATGNTAGLTRKQYEDLIQSLVESTTQQDEAVRDAMTTLMRFTNVRGEVFERATRLSADLAAAMKTDLPSAAQMLGRALQDPDQSLGALNRTMRLFNEEQIKTIQEMVRYGRAEEARMAVIKRVEQVVGGMANMMNEGLGASITKAGRSWNEFLERLGETKAIGATLETFFNRVSQLLDGMASHVSTVEAAWEIFKDAIGANDKEMIKQREREEAEANERFKAGMKDLANFTIATMRALGATLARGTETDINIAKKLWNDYITWAQGLEKTISRMFSTSAEEQQLKSLEAQKRQIEAQLQAFQQAAARGQPNERGMAEFERRLKSVTEQIDKLKGAVEKPPETEKAFEETKSATEDLASVIRKIWSDAFSADYVGDLIDEINKRIEQKKREMQGQQRDSGDAGQTSGPAMSDADWLRRSDDERLYKARAEALEKLNLEMSLNRGIVDKSRASYELYVQAIKESKLSEDEKTAALARLNEQMGSATTAIGAMIRQQQDEAKTAGLSEAARARKLFQLDAERKAILSYATEAERKLAVDQAMAAYDRAQAARGGKVVNDLELQIQRTEALAEATLQGGRAVGLVELRYKALEAALRGQGGSVQVLTQAYNRLRVAEDQVATNRDITELQDQIEERKLEIRLIGASTQVRERELAMLRLTRLARDREITPEDLQKLRDYYTELARTDQVLAESQKAYDDWWDPIKEGVRDLQHEFSNFFESVLTGGMSKMESLWQGVSRMMAKIAAQIAQSLFLNPLLKWGAEALGFAPSVLGLARGGVLQGGSLVPFASGGILDRPTVFPMANGMGLAGEAGPEAIVPLMRNARGQLGVSMAGAGGPTKIENNITVNMHGSGPNNGQQGPGQQDPRRVGAEIAYAVRDQLHTFLQDQLRPGNMLHPSSVLLAKPYAVPT